MGYWSRIFGSGAGRRQKGLQMGSPASSRATAVPVTLDTALQLSAVWACVKLISETIGSLPIRIYNVDKNGVRSLNTDHPLNRLFNGKINLWQTRQEFFECITYQQVLLGNNYSLYERNNKGEIISILPLMSQQMEVALDDNGTIQYKYTDGSVVRDFTESKIWHNKTFGNGIIGLSPLDFARMSIGIAQAAEESVTGIYSNGGKASGILSIDKAISAAQRDGLKDSFKDLTYGSQQRLFVLEAGMKFEQVSLSPQDIELLASRKFQIEDIARFFGVPSVLINDTSTSTTWGSGIQQIVEGWYKLGLRPYLERYEASMKARLLTAEERVKLDIEFDLDQLLQPSFSARITTGKEAVTGGLITPDEFRASEGMAPKEGGDNLFMQQQMTPIKLLSDPKRTLAPAPASNPDVATNS